MQTREVFYAATSIRVDITHSNSSGIVLLDDDYIIDFLHEFKDQIDDKLSEHNLSIDNVVDSYAKDGRISLFFVDNFDFILGEKPFRGYTMREGEDIIPSDDIMKVIQENISDEDDIDTSYKIYRVEHNDKYDEVNYYVQCLLDGKVIEIQTKEE